MISVIKNHPIKTMLLVVFLTIEYLNFTGFCYSEGKYFSKEELLKKAVGKIYEESPGCCAVYDIKDKKLDYLVNVFFGNRLYGLVLVTKREIGEGDDPKEIYKRVWGYITSCGIAIEDYSENITKEQV